MAGGTDARAAREIAYRSLQRNEPKTALDQIQHALELEPGNSDGFNIRGMARAQLGLNEDAARDFRRAGELAPAKSGAWMNLGKLDLSLKRYPQAAQSFQNAFAASPRNVEAARSTADAWRVAGSSLLAKKFYRSALQLAPDDAGAHAGLGRVLISGGRPEAAREELERARQLGDASAETRGYLGLACALSAETAQDARVAVEHLQAARANGEQGAQIYYGLGVAELVLGEYAPAEAVLKQGLRSYPDVAGLYYTLADVYAATGRFPESQRLRVRSAALTTARQDEDRLVEQLAADPKDVEPYLAYARWLTRRRELARAVPIYRQVLALDPRNAEAAGGLERALSTRSHGTAAAAADVAHRKTSLESGRRR